MADEQIPTIGKCYACKRTFGFTQASVTTIMIDPETGLPPDRSVLGTTREPTPEATARATRQPICPDCLDQARRFKEFMQRPPMEFPPWRGGAPDPG
jgi:hypothetical protein